MNGIISKSDTEREETDESGSEEEVGENVQLANQVTDPLALDETCRHFTCKDSSTAIIKYYTVQSLSKNKLLNWTLDLLQRNMRSMYEESSWGWKPEEKKEEMTEDEARFIVAFINEKPVAFSHFRFDMDYGHEVVYCYEVQLEPHIRSLGLGKHLMRTLESFSAHLNLSKLVLTVFKHNKSGVKFFRKIGYKIDYTSPKPKEKECYQVMSKPTPMAKPSLKKN